MACHNGADNDQKCYYVINSDRFVFVFGQYDLLRFAMPNGNQNNSNDHPKPVLDGEVARGIILHGVAVKLYHWAQKIQNDADEQLGMRRYQRE